MLCYLLIFIELHVYVQLCAECMDCMYKNSLVLSETKYNTDYLKSRSVIMEFAWLNQNLYLKHNSTVKLFALSTCSSRKF